MPLCPVTVKDTVVVVADWFVAIVTLDICELVMFPLIARSTVEPLSVVAGTVAAVGVGVGNDVVGVGIAVVVGVGVGVGDGDGVGGAPTAFNTTHTLALILREVHNYRRGSACDHDFSIRVAPAF